MRIDLLEKKTDYIEKAKKRLNDEGVTFSDDCPYGTTPDEVINTLSQGSDPIIHAYNGAKDWLDKYMVGVARLICDNFDGDPEKATKFLVDNIEYLSSYIEWAKTAKPKIENEKERIKFDQDFMETMTMEDVKAKLQEVSDELDAESEEMLAGLDLGGSDYEVIPIESYDQLHSLFGGDATGGYEYNGDINHGSAGWCHTNGENTYDHWVDGGKYRFFILAKKGWEDIPYNEQTSRQEQGADEYGNSLMALCVNKYGDLRRSGGTPSMCCTLRCNHQGGGNLGRPTDAKYQTWAEIAKVTNMDIESIVKSYCEERKDITASYNIVDGILKGFGERYDEDEAPTKLDIPEGVISIADRAFSRCGYIEIVKLPSSCLAIGAEAFSMCTSLKSIDFGSVETIGARAFQNCESLTDIKFPESVIDVGAYTFRQCLSLSKVSLGNLTTIPQGMFEKCASLESVVLPTTLTEIEDDAFDSCALTSIVIPEGVVEIGDDVFSDCENLKSVTLPSTLEELGAGCFDECASLESISFPDGLEVIEESVCADCKSLTSVHIPNSVVEIGKLAFTECYALESIVIPDSVEAIKKNAFARCRALAYVTLPEGIDVDSTAFDRTPYAEFPQAVQETEKPVKKEAKTAKKGQYSMLHEMLKGINK